MIGARIDSVSTASGNLVIKYTTLLSSGRVVGGQGLEMSRADFDELAAESTLSPADLIEWMLQSVKNRGLNPTSLIGKRIRIDHNRAAIVEIL